MTVDHPVQGYTYRTRSGCYVEVIRKTANRVQYLDLTDRVSRWVWLHEWHRLSAVHANVWEADKARRTA